MIRLTAFLSGRVLGVGYRVKAISLADEMGLASIIQDCPDSSDDSVLVIAEAVSYTHLTLPTNREV